MIIYQKTMLRLILGPTFGIRCKWNCSCNRRKSHENPLLISKVLQVLVFKDAVANCANAMSARKLNSVCFLFSPDEERETMCPLCKWDTHKRKKKLSLGWGCEIVIKELEKTPVACSCRTRKDRGGLNVGVTNLPPHAHKPHTNQSDRHRHLFLSHSEIRLCFNGRLLSALSTSGDAK